MKKSISIILSLFVLIFVTACGDSNSDKASSTTADSKESAPSQPVVSASAVMQEKIAAIEAAAKQLESANADGAREIQRTFTDKMAELDEQLEKAGKQVTEEEQAKLSEVLTKYRIALKAAYSRR